MSLGICGIFLENRELKVGVLLTQDQVRFFETFGFFVFRQEFLSDEVENIISAAEAVWEEELGQFWRGDAYRSFC